MYPHGAHLHTKNWVCQIQDGHPAAILNAESHFLTTVLGSFLNHNIYGLLFCMNMYHYHTLKKLWNAEVIRFKMADRRPFLFHANQQNVPKIDIFLAILPKPYISNTH